MENYRVRIADSILDEYLDALGAVLIEGPKACGKTTTAEQHAKSILYMDNPAHKEQFLQMADSNISNLLEGETPHMIDEWQLAPKLWDAIRFTVDHRQEDGQFILTGSAVPFTNHGEISHTGTGRFAWLKMRPMSLWESGDSNGTISLSSLFEQEDKPFGAKCEMSMERLAFLTCRGGWPKSLDKKTENAALLQVRVYLQAVVRSDISRVDDVERNPDRALRLLKIYARHQGASVSIATIAKDLEANEAVTPSVITVDSYLNALRKIFVIEDMPAWNPNLRSKTAIRTSDTRYFVDPSIAVAALGLGPKDLINDLNTFGLLFETMCVRDLRVYADALGGTVYHYRDKNGLECDAVVHLRNGSYGLVEIKLGGDKLVAEGAASLLKLVSKIDTTKMKAPSFMMVLTGVGEYAYQRTDGVFVVPVGCLKD